MSSLYTPDSWVLVKISDGQETIVKCLGGWSGSYLYGSSWRLSSGVTKIEDKNDDFIITNYSGSVYLCPKGRQTLAGMMHQVIDSFIQKAEREGGSIELITLEQAQEFLAV